MRTAPLPGGEGVSKKRRRLTGGQVALLLVALVLIAAVFAGYLAVTQYLSTQTQRSIEANWGISAPDGLRVVEYHQEESFFGDGYRFTVLEIQDGTELEGTFFDARQMSGAELTSEQIDLVVAVTKQHSPENYLTVPQSGLRKAEISREDRTLLCLLDQKTNRFYIYEWIT